MKKQGNILREKYLNNLIKIKLITNFEIKKL